MFRAEIESPHSYSETEFYIAPGVPFYFDPEINRFVADDRQIAPTDLDDLMRIKVSDVIPDSKPEDSIVMTMLGLVQLSNSRKALSKIYDNERSRNAATSKIEGVMKDVFLETALVDGILLPKKLDSDFFKARFSPGGTFNLVTLGDCACLSTDPHTNAVTRPRFSRTDFPPTGYATHNIDLPSMLTSLIAGAGTVAWITKNS